MSLPALVDPTPLPAHIELRDVDVADLWLAALSPATRRAYRSDLGHFARHVGAAFVPTAVSMLLSGGPGLGNRMAIEWRAAMEGQSLSAATIARRLSALRSVVDLARSVGAVTWTLAIRAPKVIPYRDVRGPGRGGWRAMLAECRTRGDAKGLRDLALVRVLHDLMLRRSEAVGLDLEHVERDGGRVTAVWILGKARSDRERLELAKSTAAALEAWLAARGGAPGPVFTRLDRTRDPARPQRLSDHSVAVIVGQLGAAAGLERAVRPHGLRHEGITRAIELGEPLLDVQLAARHADPRTTQRYIDRVKNPQPRISESISRD